MGWSTARLGLVVAAVVTLASAGCGAARPAGTAAGTTTTPTVAGDGGPSGPDVYGLFLGPEVAIVAAEDPDDGCSTVYWTRDFVQWRNITPPTVAPPGEPAPPPGECIYQWSSASFVSSDDGWVLGSDGGSTDTVLFHTVNGGRSWIREPGDGTGSSGGWEVIGFASPEVGWRQQFATGSNAPYALELTENAGVTWSLLPYVDAHGGNELAPVVFADRDIAFAAEPLTYTTDSYPSSDLHPWVWRTTNGGRSWTHLTVAAPASLAGASAFYGEPQFFARDGVLPVAFVRGSSTWVGFYRSTDWGIDWHLVAVVATESDLLSDSVGPSQPQTSVSGAFPVVAIAGPQTWWVVGTSATGARTVAVTADGGRSWTSVSPTGIPRYTVSTQVYASQKGFISSLQASGATRAWMTVIEGANVESQASVQLQTSDGGRTWSLLEPHGAGRAPG